MTLFLYRKGNSIFKMRSIVVNSTSFFNTRSSSSSSTPTILKIGEIFRESRTFSDDDILQYSRLSFDRNPLHFDVDCARSAGFEDRLVPGILVASLFPRIIATQFPGALYVSQNLKFQLPIYVGEEIIGEVETTHIRPFKDKYLAKFVTKCYKDGGRIVIDGDAKALLTSLSLKGESCTRPE
ncbi:(R)-specific enoyl-CoA hydratase [Impatiens glandulifera]|uniref:(R)-specific enoyl-CoA hydratase n=1 Tax=Impatiens glandulifera TaxID=253017 RepID=UPI001FB0E477|nr:(R)-specific enoyl-CoA hydratase [Impatiens glandulifera]